MRRALQYGTTTVRVMDVNNFPDVGIRELRNGGMTDPDVVAAGYQIPYKTKKVPPRSTR